MNILFLARPDLSNVKAGDTVQIEKLRAALNKMGVSVELSTDLKPSLKKYDLVHCFNMLRIDSCISQCRWVKDRGKPLILTPIYWDMQEYLAYNYPDKLKWWNLQQKKRYKLLKMIDLLAPNGEREYKQIKKKFSLSLPYKIIYNGVEEDYIKKKPEYLRGIKRDIILSVGRNHPRKNQLNMIKALNKTKVPIVFIGNVNDRQYYRLCQEEANECIKFIDHIDREKLKEYYLRAKTHLMVSWYDTPGLVNLEAGLAGCNLVVTSRGTTYEYFKDKASYCAPNDLEQIRRKVEKSFVDNTERKIASYILSNFTWEKIALNTRNIYSEFLGLFN
jgi:glycosyltransferase involved in cell wall biosynthesis